MQDAKLACRRPAVEQRLDELGATLSARPQLGPEPDNRARLLRRFAQPAGGSRTNRSE